MINILAGWPQLLIEHYLGLFMVPGPGPGPDQRIER